MHYDNIVFMIEPSYFAQGPIAQLIEAVDFPDGRLQIRHKGRSMPYWTFEKIWLFTETAVIENRRPGGIFPLLRQKQETGPPRLRTRNGPRRREQTSDLFGLA